MNKERMTELVVCRLLGHKISPGGFFRLASKRVCITCMSRTVRESVVIFNKTFGITIKEATKALIQFNNSMDQVMKITKPQKDTK